jgi:hypothetical protein
MDAAIGRLEPESRGAMFGWFRVGTTAFRVKCAVLFVGAREDELRLLSTRGCDLFSREK